MPECILTGATITSANDSKAHIIPSALGGRLKPKGILSNAANTLIGEKIDNTLIEAFQPLATLLDISRDRGKNQPIRMTDDAGQTVLLEFGKPLTLDRPDFQKTPDARGDSYQIKARTLKEARTLLGRIKADHPSFDIDDAMTYALKAHEWPTGMLRSSLSLGPITVFPSLFVGASIFAVSAQMQPHPMFAAYVNGFDPDHPTLPPDTFYFETDPSCFSTEAQVAHIVAVIPDPDRKRALAYMQLFNLPAVAVLLPYTGSTQLPSSYAIDVLSGQVTSVDIDVARLLQTPWVATHTHDELAFQEMMKTRLTALIRLGQSRAADAWVEETSEKLLGAHKTLNSGRDMVRLVEEIADLTLHEWRRPFITVDQMTANLKHYDQLCAGLTECLPRSRRWLFRCAISPQRKRLNETLQRRIEDYDKNV